MPINLTSPIFRNERKALAHIEASRWPDGPYCPYCGVTNVTRMGGKTQAGMFQCNGCRKKFTVRVGTVFERSHIPLHKWLLAMHLMASSKKGVSAHQLWRTLGFGSYRTAWFMAHRIREAMKVKNPTPIGGKGKVVEADETYFGNVKHSRPRNVLRSGEGWTTIGGRIGQKWKVVALVERGGEVRSVKVDSISANEVRRILVTHADRKSELMTDESNVYIGVGKEFKSHETVKHIDKEYVRGVVTTNTIEGVFSIFKRGMRGIYQHCGEQHLHRYLAEFDFRYNNRIALGVDDIRRSAAILKGAEGKRLMYHQPREAAHA